MKGCALAIIKLGAFRHYRSRNVRLETAEYLFNRKMAQQFDSPTGQAMLNPVKGVVALPPRTPHPPPPADALPRPVPAPGASAKVLNGMIGGKSLSDFMNKQMPGPGKAPTIATAPAISTAQKSSCVRTLKLARALKLLVGGRGKSV